jgi:AcrR family transcriptional regulator
LYKGKMRADSRRLSLTRTRRSGERRRAAPTPRPARRAEIIAAAIQVIARDGSRACTVSALERETGFARGHFTYHFDAKEEIIALAFATVASDWATAQVEAAVGATALARIEARVRAAVAWAQRRPDHFRCLMTFRVEMVRDPTAFPLAADIRGQIRDYGAQMIREAIGEGTVAAHVDPELEAWTMFAIVDGFLLHAALEPSFCPPDVLPDLVWRAIAERLGVAAL